MATRYKHLGITVDDRMAGDIDYVELVNPKGAWLQLATRDRAKKQAEDYAAVVKKYGLDDPSKEDS